MNTKIEFIRSLDKQLLFDYAEKLLHKDTWGWKITDELNFIMVYKRTIHDHYWEEIEYIKFSDFGFNIRDSVHSSPAQSYLWAEYVHENLPNELKNKYAKEWNELYSDAAQKDYKSLFTKSEFDFKLPITESEPADAPAK